MVPRRCVRAACSSARGGSHLRLPRGGSPAGTLASCPGPLLARSSETHIHIHGTSIHIAKTYGCAGWESHDAALAGSEVLVAERELMDELGHRRGPALASSACCRQAPSVNAVAGRPMLPAAYVCLQDDMFDRARRRAPCTDEACAATGCTYDLNFVEGYPPVDNDPELFGSNRARSALNCSSWTSRSANRRGFRVLSAPSTGRVLSCWVRAFLLSRDNPERRRGLPRLCHERPSR